MASFASQGAVLRSSLVAVGLSGILLAHPTRARAGSDPDIPRMQAEAERGSIKEEVELGAAYFAGRGVTQDEKRAAYWYEKAANSGDPQAQMEIGYFYQAGIGVGRDPAKALKWYQRAAAGGVVGAKVNLGVAYLVGSAVRKDPELAADLFHQAFAQGSGLAACYLGEMYSQGLGAKRDEAAAEHWFEAGAKLHDARAEFELANLLWHRQKDTNETKRAMKLLRESAAAGLVYGKHQLGITILKHPELASSPQEATTALNEAAEAGEWRSSTALGLISREGILGTPMDARTAYYHYRVAALQGGEQALRVVQSDLEALGAKLGREQAAAIDADAAAWFDKHHLALIFINKEGPKSKEFPVYAVAIPSPGASAGWLIPNELSAPSFTGESMRRPTMR